MDQIGNVCRCHCHSTFTGKEPMWNCYCRCTTGNKTKENKNIMITKEHLLNLSEKIDNISRDLAQKHAQILESELKSVCELYEIPTNRIHVNLFPDGVYRVSIVLSEFQIKNTFKYGD